MMYFSLLVTSPFQVRDVVNRPLRHRVPFENGYVDEVVREERCAEIESETARKWDDFLQDGSGEKCLYFSPRARELVEEGKFTGIVFNSVIIRRIDVPKILNLTETPRYSGCSICGHIRAVDICNESYKKEPFTLDSSGLEVQAIPLVDGGNTSHLLTGKPLVSQNSPDFLEPAPMRSWTVLVSERVAAAFKAAKLTGYKLNPLMPGGRCRL